MHVLVCEDDPAARFVAKRWLQTALGCTVTECEDGVEALSLLSAHNFDLAVIDLDLPRLSGVEVVEALRGFEATRDLPVVILSNERRGEVVRKLLDLGISDYLLKPLRAQTVYERIGPLLSRRRRAHTRVPGAVPDARLGPDSPALLVDGDANFRHVFTQVAAPYGAVVCAESGAAALAVYRRNPLDLVFVGDGLGLVTADVLVRKIRDFGATEPLVVRVGVPADLSQEQGLFDLTMPRAFIPSSLDRELRRFVRVIGPLSSLEELAPHFSECLASAVPQVLGMMGGIDVGPATDHADLTGELVMASVTADVDGRVLIDLDLALTRQVAHDVSMRLLGCDAADVGDEVCASTTSELLNMVSGRLDVWLKDRGLACKVSLPSTRTVAAGDTLPEIPVS